jgi:predicted transcriptional regulator
MHVRKNVLLEPSLCEDIEYRRKEFKFNFSEWVREKYISEFMNLDSKEQELKETEQKLEILKQEIEHIKKEQTSIQKQANRQEMRFLCNISNMIKKGSNLDGLHGVFNDRFKRKLTFIEFKDLWGKVKNGKNYND